MASANNAITVDAAGESWPRTVSIDEAARLLDRHPQTIRQMIRRDELRAWKVGGRWAVETQHIRTLLGLGE